MDFIRRENSLVCWGRGVCKGFLLPIVKRLQEHSLPLEARLYIKDTDEEIGAVEEEMLYHQFRPSYSGNYEP